MTTNCDTLLCHIYGIYRVVSKQGTFRFVVLNNVIDTSRVIHERLGPPKISDLQPSFCFMGDFVTSHVRYDLKGSMVNRHVSATNDIRTTYKVPPRPFCSVHEMQQAARVLVCSIIYHALRCVHTCSTFTQSKTHLSFSGRCVSAFICHVTLFQDKDFLERGRRLRLTDSVPFSPA